MEAEVTLKIPKALYTRAERLATARHQPVTKVLDEAIALVESHYNAEDQQEALMVREEQAYLRMHAHLMEKYQGQYVAILNGQLIDHDPSEMALLQRLDHEHPDDVVLMRRVEPLPEPELVFRSPQFV